MSRRTVALDFAAAMDLSTQPGLSRGELVLYRTNELPFIVPFPTAGLDEHMKFLGRVAMELGSAGQDFPMFFGGCLAHLPAESTDWTLAAMLCAIEQRR